MPVTLAMRCGEYIHMPLKCLCIWEFLELILNEDPHDPLTVSRVSKGLGFRAHFAQSSLKRGCCRDALLPSSLSTCESLAFLGLW